MGQRTITDVGGLFIAWIDERTPAGSQGFVYGSVGGRQVEDIKEVAAALGSPGDAQFQRPAFAQSARELGRQAAERDARILGHVPGLIVNFPVPEGNAEWALLSVDRGQARDQSLIGVTHATRGDAEADVELRVDQGLMSVGIAYDIPVLHLSGHHRVGEGRD